MEGEFNLCLFRGDACVLAPTADNVGALSGTMDCSIRLRRLGRLEFTCSSPHDS
jgi:hypothetical protein